MSVRFFADHYVPSSLIHSLREAGIEVLVLRDYLPTDSPDRIVISKAKELNAILLSLNGDFADIVSYPPAGYNGIVSVQRKNHPELIPTLTERLIEYLKTHIDKAYFRKKLIIAEPHRIRIRS